jgi:outer membrane protein
MITRYFTLLVLAFSSLTVLAQQTAKLTFKEAVKIGLDKNLTLNQQENLLVSAQVNKTAGLMGFGPSVAVTGNTGRNDGNSFNQQEGRVINGVLDFTRASLEANMPLFRGLSTMNTYRQSASQYEAQLHAVNRTSQDVIRDIARQYLTCLLDQRLVAINEKNVELQRKQAEQIQAQVEAGSRAEVDLKNQEYQVKNAELLLVRAKNTFRNDKAILAQTLQLDPFVGFELEEPTWPISELDGMSLDQLYTLAAEKRSDLRRASENEKAAHFGYLASKGTYFPSVNAFASYGSTMYIHRPSSRLITAPSNNSFSMTIPSLRTGYPSAYPFIAPSLFVQMWPGTESSMKTPNWKPRTPKL